MVAVVPLLDARGAAAALGTTERRRTVFELVGGVHAGAIQSGRVARAGAHGVVGQVSLNTAEVVNWTGREVTVTFPALLMVDVGLVVHHWR